MAAALIYIKYLLAEYVDDTPKDVQIQLDRFVHCCMLYVVCCMWYAYVLLRGTWEMQCIFTTYKIYH
jgi:hypothetical protein